jgi:hypothetical protein
MNQMDGKKKPFNNFFKLNALGRKKNWSFHEPNGWKIKTFQQFLQTTFPDMETK